MMRFPVFLREHVKPSVRILYVITEGGDIPNAMLS
jgi:hypothetical protein